MNGDPFEAERQRIAQAMSSFSAEGHEILTKFVANMREQRDRLTELHREHSALRPEIQAAMAALDVVEHSFNREFQQELMRAQKDLDQQIHALDEAERNGPSPPRSS